MACSAELDGVGDRGVVGDAAVHQRAVLPAHGRHDAGDRSARQDGIDDRTVGEAKFLTADDVHGDDVQRDRHLFERIVLDVACDQLAQAGRRDKVIARAEEAEQPGERVQREDLPAPQVAPDGGERVGGLHGLGSRGDERAVHRAGRRPDDDVGDDAALVEGVQHPDLDRAEPGGVSVVRGHADIGAGAARSLTDPMAG